MWECFLVKPAGLAQLRLRRYKPNRHPEDLCPITGRIHNASTHYATVTERIPQRDDDEYWPSHAELTPTKEHPLWPTHCEAPDCHYEFTPEDPYQLSPEHYYQHPTTGQNFPQHQLPPGAMFDAFWMPTTIGNDNFSPAVILPPGGFHNIWLVDHPSKDGQPWSRSGSVPRITAHPSIKSPYYHGWLTNGILSDDLEGRTYQ